MSANNLGRKSQDTHLDSLYKLRDIENADFYYFTWPEISHCPQRKKIKNQQSKDKPITSVNGRDF
jgi:hypothetical protein